MEIRRFLQWLVLLVTVVSLLFNFSDHAFATSCISDEDCTPYGQWCDTSIYGGTYMCLEWQTDETCFPNLLPALGRICSSSYCNTHGDCGYGAVCLSNVCSVPTSDADCSQYTQYGVGFGYFDSSDNKCHIGQCTVDADCAPSDVHAICTSPDHLCELPPYFCIYGSSTYNCNTHTGYYCPDDSSNTCVAGCDSQYPCHTGYTCNNNSCVAEGYCTDNSSCVPYTCNTGTNSCLSYCNDNSMCTTGYHCYLTNCISDSGSESGSILNGSGHLLSFSGSLSITSGYCNHYGDAEGTTQVWNGSEMVNVATHTPVCDEWSYSVEVPFIAFLAKLNAGILFSFGVGMIVLYFALRVLFVIARWFFRLFTWNM